jgi:hypothetical protein
VQQLINNGLRQKFRAGIKESRSDDWVAPFNLTASISGTTLDSHLHVLAEEVRIGIKDGTARHERDVEKLLSHFAAAGVRPVLIGCPIHPRLVDDFMPTATRVKELAIGWAAKYNGVYADASLLLDASGFADGQHLNEKGRGLLSTFIGSQIPPPPAKP